MTAPRTLDDQVLAEALAKLPGWKVVEGHLVREFRFDSFARAFGFMTASAIEAERLDHHPDWTNCYDRVKVRLRTHTPDGLTTLDAELARRMSALAHA